MRKSEMKVLLDMLPAYAEHMEKHPHSLITRFFGLHKLRPLHGRSVSIAALASKVAKTVSTVASKAQAKSPSHECWGDLHSQQRIITQTPAAHSFQLALCRAQHNTICAPCIRHTLASFISGPSVRSALSSGSHMACFCLCVCRCALW
jgi:hypothetical protein